MVFCSTSIVRQFPGFQFWYKPLPGPSNSFRLNNKSWVHIGIPIAIIPIIRMHSRFILSDLDWERPGQTRSILDEFRGADVPWTGGVQGHRSAKLSAHPLSENPSSVLTTGKVNRDTDGTGTSQFPVGIWGQVSFKEAVA